MSGGMVRGHRPTTGPAAAPRTTRQASKAAAIPTSPQAPVSDSRVNEGAVESPSAAGGVGGTPGPYAPLGPRSLASEDSAMPGLQTISDSSVAGSPEPGNVEDGGSGPPVTGYDPHTRRGEFLGNIMQATERRSNSSPPQGDNVFPPPENSNAPLGQVGFEGEITPIPSKGKGRDFYRDRVTGAAIESSKALIPFEFDAVNSGKAVLPEGVHPIIQFSCVPELPVPQSLSTVGQGAVNALPGVGRLPVGWSQASVAVNTGALSAREVPFPEGASLREVRNTLASPAVPMPTIAHAEQSYISAVVPAPNEPVVTNIVPTLNVNAIPLLASHWTSYNFRNLPSNARSVTSNGGTITEARAVNTSVDSGAARHTLYSPNTGGGGGPPSGTPVGGGGGGPSGGGGGGPNGPPFNPPQGGIGGGGGGRRRASLRPSRECRGSRGARGKRKRSQQQGSVPCK
ncbi:hypothetical protein K438DRAFT_1764513 [Mycena galopus ATCC 62051]|nr:hypothetical protein K438DRAFT_1764513 [Mycena galopus ATCC 62051]